MGPSLALFDVGVAALKASGNPKDKTAVANAMKTLKVATPVGHLHWGKGPVPNVVQTPILGGQWLKAKGGTFKLEWVFCEHADDQNVPIQAKLQAVQRVDSARSWGRKTTPILAAAGIRKRFGALVVLDGVDFAVGAGDAVGIVGPNGAGKTTLLNVLSGALRPSRGLGARSAART